MTNLDPALEKLIEAIEVPVDKLWDGASGSPGAKVVRVCDLRAFMSGKRIVEDVPVCKGCDGEGCRMVVDPDEQMAVPQTCGRCNGRGIVPIGDGYSVDPCPDCAAPSVCVCKADETTGWTTWGGIPLCNVCSRVRAEISLEMGRTALYAAASDASGVDNG